MLNYIMCAINIAWVNFEVTCYNEVTCIIIKTHNDNSHHSQRDALHYTIRCTYLLICMVWVRIIYIHIKYNRQLPLFLFLQGLIVIVSNTQTHNSNKNLIHLPFLKSMNLHIL